ncbi:Protein TIFY 11B -like protein [Gossypium arboreum]|uniref:Protein TIFY n=1 Tax=Gossypium arboreum TaxID=29729 RepID=A0A0B0N750_GOSAR
MSNLGQKSPDRASFVNLLSQYLKEKRNLGDFSLGMTSKPDAKGLETSRQQAKNMNFLSNMPNCSESSRPNLVASTSNVKSSDFFPQIGSFCASSSKEDTINKTDFMKSAAVEPKNAQLTIFFGGQVLVYNDFPADKVKEIMAVANRGWSTACSGVVADSSMEKLNANLDKIDYSSPHIPDLNITSATVNSSAQDPSVERHQYVGSDLRIARRNSLHKFFEKRKDRAAMRAPYQLINYQGSPPPPKPEENKPSHEEGQSSKETPRDIDLNL